MKTTLGGAESPRCMASRGVEARVCRNARRCTPPVYRKTELFGAEFRRIHRAGPNDPSFAIARQNAQDGCGRHIAHDVLAVQPKRFEFRDAAGVASIAQILRG